MTIEDLNVKIKNEQTGEWSKLSHDVKAAIYLIIFRPKEPIYEIRRPNDRPRRVHDINKGDVVFKFGKINTSLEGRLLGSYSKHWKFNYEEYPPIGERRTYSNCFGDVTEIFVLHVQDELNEILLSNIESQTRQVLKNTLQVKKQEPGSRSEYYLCQENGQDTADNVSLIKEQLDAYIHNL